MSYQYLSEELRPIADRVRGYFQKNWGVGKFNIESSIHADIGYRPTLHTIMRDYHILCIEISGRAYPPGLDSFVLDCVRLVLPVKLFVAVPLGTKGTDYLRDLSRAKECGVGVVEVEEARARIVEHALSLSLLGVRPSNPQRFPSKYRQPLVDAEQTFRAGDPSKGCTLVYDEIEALSRKLAQRSGSKGLWHGGKVPAGNFEKDPWFNVVQTVERNLDYSKCPTIKPALLAHIRGLTTPRNESSHKPKTLQARIKRDNELRTRFETAVDTLWDLVAALKPFNL